MSEQSTGLGGFAGIGLDTKMADAEPFLGVIAVDDIIPSDFAADGVQWHFGVRPVRIAGVGKTGYYHDYSPSPKGDLKKASKSGVLIDGLRKAVPGAIARVGQIGVSGLVGEVGWFVRVTCDGQGGRPNLRNPETKEPVVLSSVGIRPATAEEIEEAKKLPPLAVTGSTAVSATPVVPAFGWNNGYVERAMEILRGKTTLEVIRAATSITDDDLRSQIISGAAGDYLVDQGFLAVVNDRYQAVEVEV